jgi:hypothetical protein
MTQFSSTSTGAGIVEQARDKARVDAVQWSNQKITNSCNNWLNKIFTYGKWKDRQMPIDDTNHIKLPEGTAELTINVCDYSFLTDQQGNRITNLTSVSILTNGKYSPLTLVERNDLNYDAPNFGTTSGTPTQYDKIADNIIRLDKLPPATIASGLKLTFQRAPSPFVSSDTTKQPGVADDLHEGFIVKSAYDAAYTLSLSTLQSLAIEMQREEQKLVDYFSSRNTDKKGRINNNRENNK